MTRLLGALLILCLAACASTQGPHNAPGQLALEGFDPVSYFPEGGGEPVRGRGDLHATHAGLTYRFASEDHRARFEADALRFVPAYGGWCAFAMLDGQKVGVNPHAFLIQEGRLLLFYDGAFGDTRAEWLAGDAQEQADRADLAWADVLAKDKE